MSVAAVLSPVFALIALLFILTFRMALTRVASIKAGEVKMKDIALGQSAWTPAIQQTSNAYANNLQQPLLFYALVAFAMLTKKADMLFVVMSWLYVASRYAHAWIHVTSNHLPSRFNAFAAGVLLLALMWIIFAARILAEF